jgi:hypothetical protein
VIDEKSQTVPYPTKRQTDEISVPDFAQNYMFPGEEAEAKKRY